MTDFLPEYGQMPLNGQYAALYRLFSSSEWRHVCDPATKKPLMFPSPVAAVKGAKEHVRHKLNPTIQSTSVDQGEDEDLLGVQEWLLQKQGGYAEAQIVRNRKSKTKVVVERRGREGKRHGPAKKKA